MMNNNDKEPLQGENAVNSTPDAAEENRPQPIVRDPNSTIFVKHVYNTKQPTQNGTVKRIIYCAVALALCGAIIGSVFLVKALLPNNNKTDIKLTVSVPEEVSIDVVKYSDLVKSANIKLDGEDATVDTNIQSVQIVNGLEQFTLLPVFTKSDGSSTSSSSSTSSGAAPLSHTTSWRVHDIDTSKTNSSAIVSKIKDLFNIKAFREIENNFNSVQEYHDHYGMEKELTAGAVVKFSDGTKELMITVGDILPAGDSYYLKTSLSDTVYAVKTEYVEVFFSSTKELANGTVIEKIGATDKNKNYFQNDTLARFDTIKISGDVFEGKTYEFIMNNGPSADYMPYQMSVPYKRPASDAFISKILGFAANGVEATAFYSYKATDKELKEYGLDKPKGIIELTVGDYSYKLTIGGLRNDGTDSLTAMVDGKEQIFGIDQDDLAFLISASNDVTKMFNTNFIMEDIYTMKSVEFKLKGGSYRFDLKHIPRDEDGKVKDTEVKLGDSVMNTQSFKLLYQRVLMLSLLDFVLEAEKTEPILTVTFNYIEGGFRVVEFTESKDDIYHYTAWVDGTPLGEVLKGGVDELIECVNTYLNGGTITDTWS